MWSSAARWSLTLERLTRVRAAHSAASSHLHIRTPLVESESFSAHLGARVFLKLDCLQPPGSFKIRGIGETVRIAVQDGAERIVCSSGGNAGLAAAYAAKQLGVALTVVLPETTPVSVHDLLRVACPGAEVLVHGGVWDEANNHALRLVKEQPGVAYVHPFDQSSTWQGHSSLIDEISEQLPEFGIAGPPDAVVTCVGGGGLLMGILVGLERHGWDSRVIACETEGAASLAQSLAARRLVTLPAITSMAKSLGAQTVGAQIFQRSLALQDQGTLRSFVTTDREAVRGCLRLADEHRLLVEPACGAALAAMRDHASLQDCRSIVVEVCGGALVNHRLLHQWVQDFDL